MIKTLITLLCFIFLAFCYWLFNDPQTWWRISKIARGTFELVCFILWVLILVSFVVLVWLN